MMSTLAAGVVRSDYTGNGIISAVTSAGSKTVPALTAVGSTTLNTDPRVLGFQHQGTDYALVVRYVFPLTFGAPGTAIFGIYDPTTWSLIGSKTYTEADWLFSNPYGLLIIDGTDDLFVSDNDSGKVVKLDLSDITDVTASVIYTHSASGVYSPHGYGLDYYNGSLVTVFGMMETGNFNNYDNSALVLLSTSGSVVRSYSLNKNASGVTVDGNYAYVTSFGGPQTVGGNPASLLQVVDISTTSTPVNIGIAAAPSGKGSYVDVAFVPGNAYVLIAAYNSSNNYVYQLVRTTAASLIGGTLGSYTNVGGTTTTSGTTWLLAPADDGTFWYVRGDDATLITPSLPLTNPSAVTKIADASNGSLGTATTNGVLNTAAVVLSVIPVTLAARTAAASAGRTKFAARLARPEELEAQAAQAAATKQK